MRYQDALRFVRTCYASAPAVVSSLRVAALTPRAHRPKNAVTALPRSARLTGGRLANSR